MSINSYDVVSIILGIIIAIIFIAIYSFGYSILYDIRDLKQRISKLEDTSSTKTII